MPTMEAPERSLEKDQVRARLERDLPDFLRKQRWFAGKARELDSVRLVDATGAGDLPGSNRLIVVEVRYREGNPDLYFLPVAWAAGDEAARLEREYPVRVISRLDAGPGAGILYDSLADPAACTALLDCIGDSCSHATRGGVIRGEPTSFFDAARGPTDRPLPIIRGSAEQSNSAVLYGDRLLMKVFRRLEPGVNPDLEIGRFLAERKHFPGVPKPAGSLWYERPGAQPILLCLLQELVRNQGTGWDHALHEARLYFEQVDRRPGTPPPAPVEEGSLLDLARTDPPAEVRKFIGPYLAAAATLGRRTAEMHVALAGGPEDAAFAPEPLTRQDLRKIAEGVRDQVRMALGSLKDKLDGLPAPVAEPAGRVLAGAPALLDFLDRLPGMNLSASKIRVHGDYHLGQVLRTGEDFVILDFEGEPAKPLAARLEKQTPVKDVVGLLRSFDYAAFASLFAFARDRPDSFARLVPWAHAWQVWVGAAFLKDYLATASGASFLPADPGQLALLLRTFTLDKALYELLYELNNRPDWVGIPLQGIVALIEQRERARPTAEPDRERVPAGRYPVLRSAISDFDVHLLAEGTHYRSYEKLGAHPAEQDGAAGIAFAVWAPNARAVSIVGDFNGWDPSATPMQPRGRAGLWERFVPGLAPGSLYRYAVTGSGGATVEKADPYGFATEIRPGTASMVCDLSRFSWTDQDWMATRRGRNDLGAPISIYEVHLGSWMRVPEEGGRWLTYREMAPRLADYVFEMGFTHVELMPISEHPFDGSWGYQPTGYFAPTSRFGTPDDFAALVDTLHRRGIGVILDWVPAHFPRDPHGLGEFDGTHLYEPADPLRMVHPDWDTYTFDYGRREVSNFLISNALFWLDRYHIDGLRVDAVASMLYLDYSRRPGQWTPNEFGGRENLDAVQFLRRFNERVHAEYPGVLTIAEESTAWPMVSRPTNVGGLGFDLKWDMGWMHDTLDYMATDPINRKYRHDRLTFRGLYAFSENFVLPLSHDEVVHGKGTLLGKMPGDEWQKFANLRLLFGYQFTQPGKKLLFMGQEFGQAREWNHDISLDWHLQEYPFHKGLQRWVRDLDTTYRGEPALHELDCHPSGFSWVDCSDSEKSIVSLMRRARSSDDLILVVCNFTPVPRHNYRLGVPRAGHWEEILNSDAGLYGGSNQGNIGGAGTVPVYSHGQEQSLTLTLPPLAVIALRWRNPERAR
ncbi:1,4-alpha-glucan branching enzyme GlgB [Aquisphaera giovannonii]|uniref:1,4-alpha-glucan branching enzyme GlgB n=1 Tax=Aquisphaera giovannonii TaxID=406548 RepID=A0A5B9W319_9BACT|nr:1,4-alpha-glucan branching protein GlgB [Aquisphaera giovannonii]QEH34647.1 1,4-alpha-glucan branching enzyme GlgB [Aquisphaera giovannonii]